MKRSGFTVSLIAISVMSMCGQGRVYFNNFSAGIQPVTIHQFNQGSSGGSSGDFVGSNYSIQLLWAAGTFSDQTAFDAANPRVSVAFPFFGTTGSLPNHGPTIEGAGLYDGGRVVLDGPVGIYTLQSRAWFNNGQFGDYASAASANMNRGVSQLIQLAVSGIPTPAPNTTFPAFTVTVTPTPIPEPATFALAGLSVAALLLFRRRK